MTAERRSARARWGPILLVPLLAAACSSPPPLVPQAEGRMLMGTVLEVELWSSDPEAARRVIDEVFTEVAELESLLSHYDPRSQVSRLAARSGQGPVAVDPRVAEIARLSLAYGELTDGAFDVTLGPLTQLWRSRGERRASYEEIAAARARTGLAKLRVYPDDELELLERGMSLDFGGIAKGYALDRVRELLRGPGIAASLASFGQSSVWAFGAPPETEGWTLALRSPAGGIAALVTLSDQAFSVSSSFPEPGSGTPFGDLVDPRTGWPLTRSSMVAVVSNDATRAEALSTALVLMSHEQGLRLVEAQQETEALIVDDQGRIAQSPGWLEATGFREVQSGFRGLRPR